MHYTISKEEIEQAIGLADSAATSVDADFSNESAITDLKAMLQWLLTQPEDDGSDWFYKLKFICRVLEGVSPDKTDMQTALGMARSLKRERWTAEKALQPITASDVTDEMMANFIRLHTDNMTYQKTLIAAVNAFIPSYMGANKC